MDYYINTYIQVGPKNYAWELTDKISVLYSDPHQPR